MRSVDKRPEAFTWPGGPNAFAKGEISRPNFLFTGPEGGYLIMKRGLV
jgi:hypothetical protein